MLIPAGGISRFPTLGTRNDIQPTADVTPLRILARVAGQTANLTSWLDTSSVIQARVLPTGVFSCPDTGTNSERFGAGSLAAGTSTVAVGSAATAPGLSSVAIGRNAATSSAGSDVAIGATALVSAGGGTNVAIGASALIDGGFASAVAVGQNSQVHHALGVAIGRSAVVNNAGGVAVGSSAVCSGDNAFALGRASNVASGHSGSIVIGFNVATTASKQCVIGSSNTTYEINNVYIGDGVTNAAPTSVTIQPTGGSGTDIAGGNFTIAGGRGTGSAVGGAITFQSTIAGASATTLRTLQEKMRMSNVGVHSYSQESSAQTRTVLDVTPSFVVATDASRTGRAIWQVYDTAAREAFRVEASGSAPMIGFLGAAAIARPTAYTQTYATATRTHNNVTSAAVATTAATQTTPWGYGSQAQADAIPVAINAVAADLLNLKQLMNQVIDDIQLFGLLQ